MKVKSSLKHQEPSFLIQCLNSPSDQSTCRLLQPPSPWRWNCTRRFLYEWRGEVVITQTISQSWHSIPIIGCIGQSQIFPIISKVNILPRFLQLLQSKSAPPFTSNLCQLSGTIQHCIINAININGDQAQLVNFKRANWIASGYYLIPTLPSNPKRWTTSMCSHQPEINKEITRAGGTFCRNSREIAKNCEKFNTAPNGSISCDSINHDVLTI